MINSPLYDLDMSEFLSTTNFNSDYEERDTRASDLNGVINERWALYLFHQERDFQHLALILRLHMQRNPRVQSALRCC